MRVKAHDVAADPDLYYKPCRIGNHLYDCQGYSKGGDGKYILFTRLEPVSVSSEGFVFHLHSRYLLPGQSVEVENA